MSNILLDTCAMLWFAGGTELKDETLENIANSTVHISPISAWEIANLVRKNRIGLTLPVATWFHKVRDGLSAELPALTIDVLIQSCALPGAPPADPADRIIIATARDAGLQIVTRDDAILAYGRAGHVQTLEC